MPGNGVTAFVNTNDSATADFRISGPPCSNIPIVQQSDTGGNFKVRASPIGQKSTGCESPAPA